MKLFTADAVAVLSYLADKLPHKSNEIFNRSSPISALYFEFPIVY